MLPPFPAGAGNSSNSTGLYASVSGGGLPIPSITGYGGNGSVSFIGGAGRVGVMGLAMGSIVVRGAVVVALIF